GVCAARRRRARASRSCRDPRHRRGHVEVPGAQGAAAAARNAGTVGLTNVKACERYLNAIQELADGTLGPIRRAELELHLESCDACRALAVSLQRDVTA